MLSAVLPSQHSYRESLRQQPAHQRLVHPGPLVLGAAPRNLLTPTTDRDRTVSRVFDLQFPGAQTISSSARKRGRSQLLIGAVFLPCGRATDLRPKAISCYGESEFVP